MYELQQGRHFCVAASGLAVRLSNVFWWREGGLVDETAYSVNRGGGDSHGLGPISMYKFANHASGGPFHQSNSNTRKRQRITKLTDPLTSDGRQQECPSRGFERTAIPNLGGRYTSAAAGDQRRIL